MKIRSKVKWKYQASRRIDFVYLYTTATSKAQSPKVCLPAVIASQPEFVKHPHLVNAAPLTANPVLSIQSQLLEVTAQHSPALEPSVERKGVLPVRPWRHSLLEVRRNICSEPRGHTNRSMECTYSHRSETWIRCAERDRCTYLSAGLEEEIPLQGA